MSTFNPTDFHIRTAQWASQTKFKNEKAIAELELIVQENYPVIENHFRGKRGSIVAEADLNEICASIMLWWIRIYELGHEPNGKNMKDVLAKKKQDFDRYALEIIVKLLKERYPDNYSKQCQFLLDISEKELRDYETFSEMMYNK